MRGGDCAGLSSGLPFEHPDLGAPLTATGSDWQLRTADPATALLRLTSGAAPRRFAITNLSVSRPSLEDVYLDLIAGLGAPNEEVAVS